MASFCQAGFPYRRITNHLSTLLWFGAYDKIGSSVDQLTCGYARLKKAPLHNDDGNTSLVHQYTRPL